MKNNYNAPNGKDRTHCFGFSDFEFIWPRFVSVRGASLVLRISDFARLAQQRFWIWLRGEKHMHRILPNRRSKLPFRTKLESAGIFVLVVNFVVMCGAVADAQAPFYQGKTITSDHQHKSRRHRRFAHQSDDAVSDQIYSRQSQYRRPVCLWRRRSDRGESDL